MDTRNYGAYLEETMEVSLAGSTVTWESDLEFKEEKLFGTVNSIEIISARLTN